MPLPTRILVRTDVDWERMGAGEFEKQDDPTRPLTFIQVAVSSGAIEKFERAFNFGFFAFRAEMKAIGTESVRAVAEARVMMGFAEFDDWLDDPEDELMFPIDDDDLFHPQLARHFSGIGPETGVIVWNYAAFGHAPTASYAHAHGYEGPHLLSNNWGVRKSFLRSHFSREEARLCMADHGEMHRRLLRLYGVPVNAEKGLLAAMFARLEAPAVRLVDGNFSLHFFHPATLTQVVFAYRSGLDERYDELELEADASLPERLSWASRSVDRYRALVARLAEARRQRPATSR